MNTCIVYLSNFLLSVKITFILFLLTFQTEDTEAAPLKQEQTIFTVKLVSFDATKKIPIIKEIKNLMSGFNLVQVSPWI